MELIVRSVFNVENVHRMSERKRNDIKKSLYDTIIADEDIAIHWRILSDEVELDIGTGIWKSRTRTVDTDGQKWV